MDYHEYNEMCEKAEKIFEKHLKVVLEELEKNPKPNKDAIEMVLDALEFIDMHMRRRQRGGGGGRDYDNEGGNRLGGYDRDRYQDRGQQGGYGNRQGGYGGNGMGGGMGGWNGQQGGQWM